MTRDDFEDLLHDYGRECASQEAAYEFGDHPVMAEILTRRAEEEVMAEYDRLTALIAQLLEACKQTLMDIEFEELGLQKLKRKLQAAIRAAETSPPSARGCRG